jgi:hypothetical protein
MSLTYAQLKTQVANYLKRDDLTADIPSFITMGENELNRRLDVVQREIMTSFTLTSATDTVAYSAINSGNTEAALKLWKTVNGVVEELVYKTPEQFLGLQQVAANTGQPNYWTVQGGTIIQFDRTADQSYTIYARIRSKWDISTDYATNWLALNGEDAYLFASLVQAEPFLKNDKRIGTWRTMLEGVIAQIDIADSKARASQESELVPDANRAMGAGHFNINTG